MSDNINNKLNDLSVNETKKGVYTPPHLRNKAATPPTVPAAFTERKRAGTGSNWGTSYSNDRSFGEQRGIGGRGTRSQGPIKGPDDEFFSRDDVQGRDPRTEEKLYGNQHSSGINFQSYDDIPVETSGADIPPPIESFQESDLDPLVKSNVLLAGYNQPTPVQKYAAAFVDIGRDLMACAQTGSGKTAAFLVPILSQNFKDGRNSQPPPDRRMQQITPITLILAPTRELAIQIFDESKKFAYRSWIRPCVAYGGTPIRDQLRDLERGCGLLVATPGRLADMIERGYVSLRNIKYLVLDEADRMLDMGFEPQIRRIVEQEDMPKSRQTLMFSATFPRNMQILAQDFLKEYIFLSVGRVGATSDNITQTIAYVEEEDKRSSLLDVLHTDAEIASQSEDPASNLTLVFVETKRSADMLCNYLIDQHFPATSIHGDRTQREREWAIQSFKNGKTPVLIATAVASRGLDIPNVTHVVNYDLPGDVDDYVHRIGRTGRAGNLGKSTSFFNMHHDKNIAKELYELLKEGKQEIPDWFEKCKNKSTFSTSRSTSRGRPSRGGRGGSSRFGATDSRRDNKPQGGSQYGQSAQSGWGAGGNSGGSSSWF